MKAFILTVILCVISFSARAADDTYPDTASIPDVLTKNMNPDTTIERYIANTLNPIRRWGVDQQYITVDVIDRLHQDFLDRETSQRIVMMEQYDYDGDGQVTKQEFEKGQRLDKEFFKGGVVLDKDDYRAWTFESYDENNDGVVTLKEMAHPWPGVEERWKKESQLGVNGLKELIELSPDKSGKITAEQLEQLARKAFHTVDKDGNGILSGDELIAAGIPVPKGWPQKTEPEPGVPIHRQ